MIATKRKNKEKSSVTASTTATTPTSMLIFTEVMKQNAVQEQPIIIFLIS